MKEKQMGQHGKRNILSLTILLICIHLGCGTVDNEKNTDENEKTIPISGIITNELDDTFQISDCKLSIFFSHDEIFNKNDKEIVLTIPAGEFKTSVNIPAAYQDGAILSIIAWHYDSKGLSTLYGIFGDDCSQINPPSKTFPLPVALDNVEISLCRLKEGGSPDLYSDATSR